mmetsp:Transcript_70127/g.111554  ORF Transcript_70127/g.111554 Transcript_70127/m.111554 type:complete len:214 (-) Transcript_70127:652-1293(-)
MRRNIKHSLSQILDVIVRQRHSANLRQRANNLPIVSGLTRRSERSFGALHSAINVDESAILLRPRTARQHHIGSTSAAISVRSLVNNEGIAGNMRQSVVLIAAQTIHKLERTQILFLLIVHESNVETAVSARSRLQETDTIPARLWLAQIRVFGHQLLDERHGLSVLGSEQRAHSKHDDGLLRIGQYLAVRTVAIDDGLESRQIVAQHLFLVV